jgi:threonine-phosphate decarboxylase
VSNVAQAAGIAALDDVRAYIRKSTAYIDSQRKSMIENLSAMGLTVYPAYANFIFFHCSWEIDLAQELRKKGLLIRDCANFAGLGSGYYRTAVLTKEKNTRLLEAIKEVQALWQSRL